jgi:sarcosine oxidase subunit gamma
MADCGVTITCGTPQAPARYSLRARNVELLAEMLGQPLPTKIGQIKGDVVCLGPDEWLLRNNWRMTRYTGEGQPISVVDISERQITMVLEGPRAAEVLMAGCPRDLDKIAVGQAARTVFETVEIILLRTGPERFEVEVWRSFAPWLHLALTKAAGHLV